MAYDDWIMGATAAMDNYNPNAGGFNADTPTAPEAPPRRVYITGEQAGTLPDVGPPAIPSGPQISKGVPWVNNLADRLPSALVQGLKRTVETPGALMKPNPYPEGSEEWHFYEDQKSKIATDWAAGQALNQFGSGVIKKIPIAPGEQVLGSGPVRTEKATKIMPEVAERYPAIVEPVLKKDPKTGKEFMGKDKSAEAKEVSKLRSAAQKDIDAGNYTPYFDPKERFDVNPADYPAYEPTVGTVAQRPKEKNAAAYSAASGPETAARLDAAFDRGMRQQKGAENWYMMGQLEREYIKEYGPVEGKRQFKAKFADAMAATTGGASPKDNLMMAAYGNFLKAHGEQLPEASNLYPFPISDRLGNMIQFKKMMMEGSGLTAANPKRYNFSHNYLGNRSGSTIDEQMMGLLDPEGVFGGSPPKGAYGNLEGPVNARAAARNLDPRYYQEVAWAGAKDAKDAAKGGFKAQPMIDIVNEAIERTHRITGMPKAEIVRRGLVRGEIPLYGLAGATTMGGIAAQDRYHQGE